MTNKHQKAISSPKTFPIERKSNSWVINPIPGPYPKKECVPLGILIRDVLGYAESVKEVKKITNQGICKVDGKIRKSPRFPMGIFNTLTLGEEHFRLVPSSNGYKLIEIDASESGKKLCKIVDKKMLKGGKLQLNLNDGKNIIVDKNFDLDTGSAILLKVPEMKIEDKVPLKSGSKVMLTSGKNRGKISEYIETKVVKGSGENKAVVKTEEREMDVPEKLIFPIGKNKSLIKIE